MDLHAEDIVTDRLTLRLLRSEDAAWIAREIANPSVHRWLTSVPHPYSLDDAQEFISLFATNPGFRVIEEAGEPQGVISIEYADTFDASRPHQVELGYWLQESAWGRGLMTEAATALVQWHWSRSADTICSGWIRGNGGSEAVLRKLGFKDAGSAERRSEFFDGTVTLDRVRLAAPHD